MGSQLNGFRLPLLSEDEGVERSGFPNLVRSEGPVLCQKAEVVLAFLGVPSVKEQSVSRAFNSLFKVLFTSRSRYRCSIGLVRNI